MNGRDLIENLQKRSIQCIFDKCRELMPESCMGYCIFKTDSKLKVCMQSVGKEKVF